MTATATKATVYDIVTDRVLTAMDKGTIPWHKPWRSDPTGKPVNIRGTCYRGINRTTLSMSGYSSPVWLTFKQAQELGGMVRKGERSTPVVFWLTVGADKNDDQDDSTRDKSRHMIARYYSAFNLEQTDSVRIPEPIAALLSQRVIAPKPDPILSADAIVEGYRNAPTIAHSGDRAFYRPSIDGVTMPMTTAFDDMDHYYSTLFHELGHSTGHDSRLARQGITDPIMFGSHNYSREELVAEFCACFLSEEAGLDMAPLTENSAAYITSWSRVLQNDRKLVVQAAQQAQRAADWIMGTRYNSEEKGEAA